MGTGKQFASRSRIATCDRCGSHFEQQFSHHRICSTCFNWNRAGRLLVAAVESLRRIGGR